MKPTVKVSIGGWAFTLEEDAFQLLNEYLQNLRAHFEQNPEANEIISDIESRLSELLQIRLNREEGIVSAQDAQEIIGIMGNPKEFDSSVEETEKEIPEKTEAHNRNNHFDEVFRKRFYRDTAGGIIGGVFSGFGHYFRIDPTILRILFVALLLILNMLSFKGAGTIVFVYVVLWIIIPKASTLTQKLSMSGANPSIEDIENRSDFYINNSYRGTMFIRVLKVFLKSILILQAIILSIALIGIILAFVWLHFDTEILGVNNYLYLLGLDTIGFKIALAIILAMPLTGLLGLCIKILNKSAFTTRSLVVFIVGLIFWFGAIFYMANEGIKYAFRQNRQEQISIDTNPKTLYINLPDDYLTAMVQQPQNPYLYYSENENDKKMFILPHIEVKKDSLVSEYKIKISKVGFAKSKESAEKKLESRQLKYEIKDSVLNVYPMWYDEKNLWDGMLYKIQLIIPENKEVIITSPLKN